MPAKRDLWLIAKMLIERDGQGALGFALAKAGILQGEGDDPGAHTWKQIVYAVDELLRPVGERTIH